MVLRMPPEWAEQELLWIGFPHDVAEWIDGATIARAQEEIAAFANAVAESGQAVRLVVRDAANEMRARDLVGGAVALHRHEYGDIWLRDTGPLVVAGDGTRVARRFGFNGWGGKFEMAGDRTVGAALAGEAGLPVETCDWVLEGGAIDGDGTGLVVTTAQCLLNPNRNPQLSQEEIERKLAENLGFDRVLWLGDGLLGDHTDGHVDNLARFVAPGELVIPDPGEGDPNAAVYADARARAEAFGLTVHRVPSPGLVSDGDQAEPASYMNFVVTNALVVVPTYGVPQDDAAVDAIGALFPHRTAIGLPADAVLAGGGSFHCASQQLPTVKS